MSIKLRVEAKVSKVPKGYQVIFICLRQTLITNSMKLSITDAEGDVVASAEDGLKYILLKDNKELSEVSSRIVTTNIHTDYIVQADDVLVFE